MVGEIIYQSSWGTHPLAQPDITIDVAKKDGSTKKVKKYSNNLSLLPVGYYWAGKSNLYEGVEYRAYKDWLTYFTDLSDYFVFSGLFNNILEEPSPREQLYLFSLTKDNPEDYNEKILTLISECQEWLNLNERS